VGAKDRIDSVDSWKALAIFAVVVIHTEPFLAIPQLKAEREWYYLGNGLQQLT
jgi:surface polysaccharide O-acyltransferase-like enzyme